MKLVADVPIILEHLLLVLYKLQVGNRSAIRCSVKHILVSASNKTMSPGRERRVIEMALGVT